MDSNRHSGSRRSMVLAYDPLKEQEAEVKDGKVIGYKVNLKVTFVLDGHAA